MYGHEMLIRVLRADEMGMGKTLQAVSLIVTHPHDGVILGPDSGARAPLQTPISAEEPPRLQLRIGHASTTASDAQQPVMPHDSRHGDADANTTLPTDAACTAALELSVADVAGLQQGKHRAGRKPKNDRMLGINVDEIECSARQQDCGPCNAGPQHEAGVKPGTGNCEGTAIGNSKRRAPSKSGKGAHSTKRRGSDKDAAQSVAMQVVETCEVAGVAAIDKKGGKTARASAAKSGNTKRSGGKGPSGRKTGKATACGKGDAADEDGDCKPAEGTVAKKKRTPTKKPKVDPMRVAMEQAKQCYSEEEDAGLKGFCQATLVVCPVVAAMQWRQEILRYTAPGDSLADHASLDCDEGIQACSTRTSAGSQTTMPGIIAPWFQCLQDTRL
jgi:hypothetical protein